MTLRPLAAFGLAVVFLAACTGGNATPEGITVTSDPPTVEPTRTATPSPTPTATPTPPAQITVAFTGDVMLDRDVEYAMATEGAGYPFEAARPLFEGVDIAVLNLEGTFTDVGTPLDKKYQFATDPGLASGLLDLPTWAVSLSNNHATDYGLAGLERTVQTLDEIGVASFGAGLTEADARREAVAASEGTPSIAFLGYSDIGETIFASGATGGVSRASVEAIAEDVGRVRAEVDFVVVTLHMGTEYTHVVTARQQELARAAIDAGADLVVGHHPHALQPIEEYETADGRTGLILYSLGNFVFDLDAEDLAVLGEAPFQSVVAVVTFEAGQPLALELRPARIDVAENRPRPATPEEAARSANYSSRSRRIGYAGGKRREHPMNIRRLLGALLTVLFALALTACGSPNDDPSLGAPADETSPTSAVSTSEPTQDEKIPLFWEYEIPPGDTPEDIARLFGVSVESVIFNNIDMAPTGESNSFVQILVPGTIAIVPSIDGILHTVRDGDTVASIAAMYDADERDIVELRSNGLDGDQDDLEPGSLILVPGGTKLPNTPATGLGGDDWTWPVEGDLLTAFGPAHPEGIDIGVPLETEVRAAHAGVIAFAGGDPCCDKGFHVIIEHEDGYQTLYGHLGKFTRTEGTFVSSGDVIGTVGMTGEADEPHLHFELRRGGIFKDPLNFLP